MSGCSGSAVAPQRWPQHWRTAGRWWAMSTWWPHLLQAPLYLLKTIHEKAPWVISDAEKYAVICDLRENYLYSRTPGVCAVRIVAVESRPHDSSQLCSWEKWEECAGPAGCLIPAVHSQLQQSPSPPLSTPRAADTALWAALTHCLQRDEQNLIPVIKSNYSGKKNWDISSERMFHSAL